MPITRRETTRMRALRNYDDARGPGIPPDQRERECRAFVDASRRALSTLRAVSNGERKRRGGARVEGLDQGSSAAVRPLLPSSARGRVGFAGFKRERAPLDAPASFSRRGNGNGRLTDIACRSVAAMNERI